MLGLHRLRSDRADYYLADLATELPAGSPPPSWLGHLPRLMGLDQMVERDGLEAMLGGRHPVTHADLRGRPSGTGGFDLTFTVPKSVSLLYGLGGDPVARQVMEAHAAAVGGAVRYLEQRAWTVRRGSGEGRRVCMAGGLAGAAFLHGVNRNEDPHLHTHVVVANVACDSDGRWSICDDRGLRAHQRAASAVHDAHLRAELTERLGLRWQSAGPAQPIDIAGLSPLMIGEFSSRAAQIRGHMAAVGAHRARGGRVAWAATREAKVLGGTRADLLADWRRRASAIAEGAADLDRALCAAASSARARPAVDEHRFAAALAAAPSGTAARRDVVAAFGTSVWEGVRAPALSELVDLWHPGPGVAHHDPGESVGAVGGVAEARLPVGAVLPRPYQLRALGPRPAEPRHHRVWHEAAQAMEGYRRQWGVPRAMEGLGVDDRIAGFGRMPDAQLVQYLRTVRHLDAARRHLRWQPVVARELGRGR